MSEGRVTRWSAHQSQNNEKQSQDTQGDEES
jgi:hypothetical protein